VDTTKKSKNLDGVIPAHWMKGLDDDSDSKSNLTPSERVKIIEKAFQDILCREPDTRDLNYYKYSSMDEQTIREEILGGEEHKLLIKNGREYKKTKNLLEETKSKVNALVGEIEDREASLKQMETLLKEKNLHIEELKKRISSPFENN
jgi:hypothetical protein